MVLAQSRLHSEEERLTIPDDHPWHHSFKYSWEDRWYETPRREGSSLQHEHGNRVCEEVKNSIGGEFETFMMSDKDYSSSLYEVPPRLPPTKWYTEKKKVNKSCDQFSPSVNKKI